MKKRDLHTTLAMINGMSRKRAQSGPRIMPAKTAVKDQDQQRREEQEARHAGQMPKMIATRM